VVQLANNRSRLFDERADFLEEQSRVVRLVARRLAGLDATQLALIDKIRKSLVGRASSGVGLFADPVHRPRFAKHLNDRPNTVAGALRLSSGLDAIR